MVEILWVNADRTYSDRLEHRALTKPSGKTTGQHSSAFYGSISRNGNTNGNP
jgi:hypothetical protein